MEFDNDTSNDCLMQHQDYSNGIYSIECKYNGFEEKLDFTDDHFLPETSFCATSDENSSETGTNKFLALNTVNKYTYKNREKSTGSSQTNRSISVNESDHSYYSVKSNRYCNKYYNQNSHFGRCRGYKFGEFNTYFNSLGLERNHCPRVYPPSRKVLPEQKHMTEEFNSQTNVSAIENASDKDNSSPGNNNIQHEIQNDIKPIIAENNTAQLIEPKSPTDKLDVSLNPSDKSSPSHDIQNEPKENGIIDKDNETTLITNEITESINAQNDDTNKKLVDKPTVEESIVPIIEKTLDDNVPEKSIEKNVEDKQSNEVNSITEKIQDAHTSVSGTMVITADNLPKNDVIVKVEKPFQNDQDEAMSTENEKMLVDNDDPEGCSEKESDDVNKINKKPDDSNVENHATSDDIQHDHEEVNKSVIKREVIQSDSADENSVSKKIPPEDSVKNEPKLVNNEEVKQASTALVPSTNEKDSKLKAIVVKNKTVKQKLVIDSEKSNNINVKSESPEEKSVLSIDILDEDDEHLDHEDEKLEITAIIPSTDISTSSKCRRRKRKINPTCDVNSGQEKENVRQKRETAQKAEEIIRKRFLHNESDSDSSDNVRSYVKNKLPNTSLKRASTNTSSENSVKKPKKDIIEITALKTNEIIKSTKNHKTLEQVRKFFWKDEKKSLSKFTQEELEEILIQKVIETITMRDEIGKLREQAKISERNQEATRLKCQQLSKQIKDFEMVLTRFSADRRTGDKNTPPIKINRSVGLQVNFLTDVGVQNLRQLQQNSKSNATVVNGENPSNKQSVETTNNVSNGRKGLKVRSPRRPTDAPPVSQTTTSTQIHVPITSTPVTPPTLVVSKTTDNHPIINPTTHVVPQQGTITLNGALTATARNQPKILNTRSNNKTENLIDLTGEEEKTKHVILPPLTAISTASNSAVVPKTPPRYQRVIQPAPPNITIAQSAIKLVQSGDKPMPAALVNNMNAPRLAFVMHGVMGQPQLLIPSKTNPIRPAVTTNNMSNNRASFPITYTGVQTLSNGAVRVVPAATTVSVQKLRHPAPLPGVTNYPVNAALKLPPPAPALKISRVANGIVLSWNMKISNEYAEIASYQLYAYQEIAGVAPTTSMWKKVGDVRALPLPMACTLTQFSEGNNYYFAVRAVDTHSRFGQYSQPGNISL
ncbi:hypothetical protein PV327_000883 [Microctonus hyperodae]|uniref:Fibronectin type-III domain-containing protein n=1 Tax=Microctonus hyperodae TaxID=165561 RepID=A0AA39L2L5_MICHY|nr:hypothetical protein PV327_000883 [Microctonus hyperodae]